MSKGVTDRSNYENIAAAIKDGMVWFANNPEHPAVKDGLKPSQMANAVNDLAYSAYVYGDSEGYEVGYQIGFSEGEDVGYTEGEAASKQAEYDWFWDIYQDKGKRIKYEMAFANQGWNDETFKPKYLIDVVQGFSMFRMCEISDLDRKIIDPETGRERNLIDFERCLSFNSTFAWAKTKRIGEIIARNVSDFNMTFAHSKIEYIEAFALNIDGLAQTFTNTFQGCENLKEISFYGQIKKSINFQWSKNLSASCMSHFMNNLYDFCSETSEFEPYQQTITLSDESWNRLENSSYKPPERPGQLPETWKEYVKRKGWLI